MKILVPLEIGGALKNHSSKCRIRIILISLKIYSWGPFNI